MWNAARLNALTAPPAQLRPEELIRRLPFWVSAEPQRLAGFQIAHYRQKLVALTPGNLTHAHLPQRWVASLCVPSLQTAQIDGPHCTLSQSESPSYLARRCVLACLRHDVLKTLVEGGFTGRQGTFSTFTPQSGHF